MAKQEGEEDGDDDEDEAESSNVSFSEFGLGRRLGAMAFFDFCLVICLLQGSLINFCFVADFDK